MSARGWAVVTGASSGIGAAFARALDARGYSLVLVARRRERLEELARACKRAEVLTADLEDQADVERVATHALHLGDVELLVNNAGFGSNGAFVALDPARELGQLKLNAVAPFVLAQRLLPAMIGRKAGGIINISSIGAFQPVPYMATYGATKAFLLSWSEALSHELRGSGVRVTCICPGPVATEWAGIAGVPQALAQAPHTISPDALVRRALAAYDGGRAVFVPGLVNWLTAFFAKIFPRVVIRAVAGRLYAPRAQKALNPRS
ncbi:MAG TPA: SDR family oxidoreductase [Polyangia bacterium]|nr:SDR family oxidoreductase [Polyangia bacterium]